MTFPLSLKFHLQTEKAERHWFEKEVDVRPFKVLGFLGLRSGLALHIIQLAESVIKECPRNLKDCCGFRKDPSVLVLILSMCILLGDSESN